MRLAPSLVALCLLATPAAADEATRLAGTLDARLEPAPAEAGLGGASSARIAPFAGRHAPGTVVVDRRSLTLALVLGGGMAVAYDIGLGERALAWSGAAEAGDVVEWPDMPVSDRDIERELIENNRVLPVVLAGGPGNPLGARALFLTRHGRDVGLVIHGSAGPHAVGRLSRAGWVHMHDRDVVDLCDRIAPGAPVIVR